MGKRQNANAVPRNGAEQGVAKIVAKTPLKKSPLFPVSFNPARVVPPGVMNSNMPNRLREKINNTVEMTPMNVGD